MNEPQTTRPNNGSARLAFSLVELLVVLAIASVITAVVAVNWTPVLDKSALTEAVERLVEIDRQTRKHAITHNRPCRVSLNLRKRIVTVSRWQNGEEFERTSSIITRGNVNSVEPETEFVINRLGSGPSYFVELEAGGNKIWLLFAGGTGQHHLFSKKQDAQTFMQNIGTRRADNR